MQAVLLSYRQYTVVSRPVSPTVLSEAYQNQSWLVSYSRDWILKVLSVVGGFKEQI